jgi:SAM-dependent methyltransferase
MEIASNDGYLLQYYKQAGIPVLGIEPAENIASEAEASGIPTECEFFGEELAQNFRRCADVVHAHNVLAHVADLNGFVRGIETVLKGNGVAIIEVPYVKDMIERCEFDTIYHEHLCYFSITSLYVLFERADLMIRNVEYFPVHDGTLRLYVEHDGKPSEVVQKLLIEEDKAGITNYAFYQGFSEKVQMLVSKLKEFLAGIKAQGGTIVAYGAAAKGCVLLNYSQIGRETIDYVVDIAPYKQGKYMPGTRLEIHPPSKILGDMPDYLLLLPWNFKDEIMNQQAEYRARGGRIIVPVPQLEVI